MDQALVSTSQDVTVLEGINCQFCGAPIPGVTISGRPKAASQYSKCLRQCGICEVGVSNTPTRGAETWIFRDPLKNIPTDIQDGALDTLKMSLNEKNRPSKKIRFGFFPTSEDAVTWVVFSYLQRTHQLITTLQSCGIVAQDVAQDVTTMLLWGAPTGDVDNARDLAKRLKGVCLDVDRDPVRLTEPDVVIDLGKGGLIFIEVKLRSGNDFKDPNYEGWDSYLTKSSLPWDVAAVRASKCYELARNWRLLNALAQGRTATLVNLAPKALFTRTSDSKQVRIFRDGLNGAPNARFVSVSWADFVRISLKKAPTWYSTFCEERGIST